MGRICIAWICTKFICWAKATKIKTYLFLVVMCLVESGKIPHLQSIGFFCGDPKINFAYKGDTVKPHVLILVTLIIPFVVAASAEFLEKDKKFDSSQYEWLKESLRWYRQYILGLIFVFFITDVGKILIGEPRPHFLDTCNPIEAVNCTSNSYVYQYRCNNEKVSEYIVQDASKSFPSGHASISVYGAMSLVWYLQNKCKTGSLLLVPVIQSICILWAIFCSLTRISDHRHHWWDVLAGSIIGISITVYINGLFDKRRNKVKSTTETWSNETTDNGYLTGRLLNIVTEEKNPSPNL